MATNPISQSSQIEFNDSVLSTKAWNSSRYDGRQLRGKEINKYTGPSTGTSGLIQQSIVLNPDISYGNTPVLQKYSRNIYIGNKIIGLDKDNPENSDLLQFDKFAYIQSNYYITINSDDSISINRLEAEEKITIAADKIGFYRAFYEDFKVGDKCNIILGDTTVTNRLRSSYPIFFNGGQLQKILEFQPRPEPITDILLKRYMPILLIDTGSTSKFYPGDFGGDIFQTIVQHNPEIGSDFFTDNSLKRPSTLTNDYETLFRNILAYRSGSDFIGDRRFFLSFCESGSREKEPIPIRTNVSGGVPFGSTGIGDFTANPFPFRTQDLAELSTGEIINYHSTQAGANFNTPVLTFDQTKFGFNQMYFQQISGSSFTQTGVPLTSSGVPLDTTTHLQPTPPKAELGPYVISKIEDATPSLLVPLNKQIQLPDGEGNKPFIILPDNLHPFIKDNITYFLTRAGIDIGDNTSPIVELNEKRRLLK